MASWEDEADDLLQEAERERQESSAAAAAAEAKQKEAEKQKESRRNKRGGGGGAAAAAGGGGGDTSSAAVDALAEKLRQQKIVEDEDRRLMDDLFAGCERPADYVASSTAAATAAKSKDAAAPAAAKTRRPGAAAGGSTGDALDSVPLRSYKDLEDFAVRLGRHIQMSPAKSPAWLRFLDLIISDCASQMELKDLVSLQHKLQARIAAKEKQVNQLAEKKKKPTSLGGNIRNYKDEMDLVYGDLSSEEEERDDEEEG